IQSHHHPLSRPADLTNRSSNHPPSKAIDPRRNRNRPTATSDALHIINPRTDNAQNPPPHRLNFRKFRHLSFTTEDTEDTEKRAFNSTGSSANSVGPVTTYKYYRISSPCPLRPPW